MGPIAGLTSSAQSPPPAAPSENAIAPKKAAFAAGERLSYDASFGRLHIGHGTMLLEGPDTLRGRTAWRAIFTISGGTFFFRVRDSTVSWFDTTTLVSLRFVQHIREGRYHADRDFQIYPERGAYVLNDEPETKSVREPLDDASFLYFLRTVPLEVGHTYQFDRYFQPEGNPITIKVLRRERVTVPAGTFNAIVVKPQFKTPGIFSQKGHAEVWLADDSTHMMLMLKSGLSFGSLNLYLTKYSLGTYGNARAGTAGRTAAFGALGTVGTKIRSTVGRSTNKSVTTSTVHATTASMSTGSRYNPSGRCAALLGRNPTAR
jgi:hypothetical protein